MSCSLNNNYKDYIRNSQFANRYSQNKGNLFQADLEQKSKQLTDKVLEQSGNNEGYPKADSISETLMDIIGEKPKDPIAALVGSEGGLLEHNGVVLAVDTTRSIISIGDVSNPDNVFRVGLSTGYTLKVNWDNITDLAKSLDLFTPEDVKRILHALQTSKHSKEKLGELEELYSKICEQLEKNTSEGTRETDVKSKSQKNAENSSETTNQVVLKPDGTRILVITTTTAGGMTTTTSLKLSETSELDGSKDNTAKENSSQMMNIFKNQAAISAYEA